MVALRGPPLTGSDAVATPEAFVVASTVVELPDRENVMVRLPRFAPSFPSVRRADTEIEVFCGAEVGAAVIAVAVMLSIVTAGSVVLVLLEQMMKPDRFRSMARAV